MKRILIVINEQLFRVGLESLLAHEHNLLVKSTHFKNQKALVEEINNYEPHVVLLDEKLNIASQPNLSEILWSWPDIRILVVNSAENQIQVFEKKEIQVSGSQDLINVIKA